MYKATLECSICGPISVGHVNNEQEALRKGKQHMKDVHDKDVSDTDVPVRYE